MKRIVLCFLPIAGIVLLASFNKQPEVIHSEKSQKFLLMATDSFDQEAAIKALRESIAGHEDDPAEEVFKNIQSFKGVPAGRLITIMEMGFSHSLGVTCVHCHNPEAWDSEDKPEKQIARDMMAMTQTINNEMLPKIQNLQGTPPKINCTTCHRGDVIPATRMN